MPDEEGQRKKGKKQKCLIQCNLLKSFEHGAFQFESEAGSFSSGNHFSHNVKEIKLTRGWHGKCTSYLRRTEEEEEDDDEERKKERKRKRRT